LRGWQTMPIVWMSARTVLLPAVASVLNREIVIAVVFIAIFQSVKVVCAF